MKIPSNFPEIARRACRPKGRLVVDDNLVRRYQHDDGSLTSIPKLIKNCELDVVEIKAYVGATNKQDAHYNCIQMMMMRRKISLLDASRILHRALYE